MIERISLSQLFGQVCEGLQLTPTQHDSAVKKYSAAGDWLGGPGSPLESLATAIYPQGSMALGTTVRPFGKIEYDLDLIFEVTGAGLSPLDLHRIVERRLRDSLIYGDKIVSPAPPRCIRLKYAGDFHLDIVPARTALQMGGTAIEVPDRELKCWIPNNPKEYGSWFEKCSSSTLILMEKAAPEAVPDQLPSDEKPPLKRVVQLWKRQRDIFFGDEKGAPSSILITTLTANFYKGETDVATALMTALTRTDESIRAAWPERISVLNPTNVDEDLCARYTDDEYGAFARWVSSFSRAVRDLVGIQGLEKISSRLETLFGEAVAKQAVKTLMEKLATARQSGSLRYAGSGLSAGTVGSAVVPRHNFYGNK